MSHRGRVSITREAMLDAMGIKEGLITNVTYEPDTAVIRFYIEGEEFPATAEGCMCISSLQTVGSATGLVITTKREPPICSSCLKIIVDEERYDG